MCDKPKVKVYLSKLPYELLEEFCRHIKEKEERVSVTPTPLKQVTNY